MISKKLFTLIISIAFISLSTLSAHAKKNVRKSFDSLGTNQEIIERARALNPNNRVQIIQKRAVDRHSRFEFSGFTGIVSGGDAHYNTSHYGGSADFHITPKWSIGVRHFEYASELTSESKQIFDIARENESSSLPPYYPTMDFPLNSTLGVVNWYPLYGKLNFFDLTTIQFDLYTLAGYGQMQLESGPTDTYTLGGGLAVWLSNVVSTRFEVRYQGYKDYFESRQMHWTIGTISLGVLL